MRVFACAVLVLAAACGTSSTDNTNGNPTSDPGAACDAVNDALFASIAKCGSGIAYPSDAMAAQKARYRTLCQQDLALPGIGLTPQTLSSCASKTGTLFCRGSNSSNSACAPAGSLANGSPCNAGDQCQSGVCPLSATTDGGTTYCGTCTASIPVGQMCTLSSSSQCASGSTCSSGTCVADATVDVGGACTASSSVCKDGLVCDGKNCVALGASGAACTFSSACQQGLYCVNKACSPPLGAGADCSMATDACGGALACDYAKTKNCVSVTFAQPGAPCGSLNGALTYCQNVQLPLFESGCDITDAVNQTGTCPQVIPDGQPCAANDKTKTCDDWASCDGGVCSLGQPACL